jgi:hypothetical protein
VSSKPFFPSYIRIVEVSTSSRRVVLLVKSPAWERICSVMRFKFPTPYGCFLTCMGSELTESGNIRTSLLSKSLMLTSCGPDEWSCLSGIAQGLRATRDGLLLPTLK